MFEIVIENGTSMIQRVKVGEEEGEVLDSTDTPDILSADESRPFWAKWSDQTISFGRGRQVGNEQLLSWEAEVDGDVLVLHVGAWTPEGVPGDWFLSPDTFTATVIARSIKQLADNDTSEPSMKASPYLANWFCFKPDSISPYQKHHQIGALSRSRPAPPRLPRPPPRPTLPADRAARSAPVLAFGARAR